MTPAVIYARFSPRPNAEECDSVEKQIERCRAYCAGHGYTVIAEYCDKDLSGGRADNRPGLQKAIAAACRNKAILCVNALSRLARCTKDAIDLAERLNGDRRRSGCHPGKRQHSLADGPLHLHAVFRPRPA